MRRGLLAAGLALLLLAGCAPAPAPTGDRAEFDAFCQSVNGARAQNLAWTADERAELAHSMTEYSAEDGLTEAEPQEYGRLRRALLSDTAAVHYDQRLLRFQQGMSRMNGGGLYKITVDGVEGCAAAEYVDRHSVLCKELLIPSQHLARAVARLAERLPADRYHVRTPAGWEGLPGSYNQAFGMVKWYDREKRALWERTAHGYMGLGFD